MRTRLLFALAPTLLVLFAPAPLAHAQQPSRVYGRLSTVEGRGPVAGAVIRFVDERSSQEVTLRTDEQGRFSRLGMRPGRYRATVEREGFAAVEVIGIDVGSSDRVRLDLEMTPFEEAPFRRQTVRYHRPLVNTEDATLSTRMH